MKSLLSVWLRPHVCSPSFIWGIGDSDAAKESYDDTFLMNCCGRLVALQHLSYVPRTILGIVNYCLPLHCVVGQNLFGKKQWYLHLISLKKTQWQT